MSISRDNFGAWWDWGRASPVRSAAVKAPVAAPAPQGFFQMVKAGAAPAHLPAPQIVAPVVGVAAPLTVAQLLSVTPGHVAAPNVLTPSNQVVQVPTVTHHVAPVRPARRWDWQAHRWVAE